MSITNKRQDDEIGVIEEIVVTATKKSETIQDVPVSITAISGAEHLQQELQQELQLSGFNLFPQTNYQPEGTSVTIRGVGTGYTYTKTAGVPVKGLKLGTSSFDIERIERIEILKGPQDALYGADVNPVTNKPTDRPKRTATINFQALIGAEANDYVESATTSNASQLAIGGSDLEVNFNDDMQIRVGRFLTNNSSEDPDRMNFNRLTGRNSNKPFFQEGIRFSKSFYSAEFTLDLVNQTTNNHLWSNSNSHNNRITATAGFQWAVTDNLRIRGSYADLDTVENRYIALNYRSGTYMGDWGYNRDIYDDSSIDDSKFYTFIGTYMYDEDSILRARRVYGTENGPGGYAVTGMSDWGLNYDYRLTSNLGSRIEYQQWHDDGTSGSNGSKDGDTSFEAMLLPYYYGQLCGC
jgi:outer membrane receptor protein involved in Fe transport